MGVDICCVAILVINSPWVLDMLFCYIGYKFPLGVGLILVLRISRVGLLFGGVFLLLSHLFHFMIIINTLVAF